MPGKCWFQDNWLDNVDFKDLLIKLDDHRAKCAICKTVIFLSNMGESALRSHASGKKHVQRLRTGASTSTQQQPLITTLMSSPSRRPEAAPTPSTTTPHNGELHLIPTKTLEAEVLWCLKLVESHWSYRSSEDSGMYSISANVSSPIMLAPL